MKNLDNKEIIFKNIFTIDTVVKIKFKYRMSFSINFINTYFPLHFK